VGASRGGYHGIGMSLPDTIFIFALALVIFGPKKLPQIGRTIGKLVFEFRRASNDFKMQIEEELRTAEAADRKRQAAAAAEQAYSPATPAASVTPAEAPGTLSIRPPTTGTMVSAGASVPIDSTPVDSAPESEPVSPDPGALDARVDDRQAPGGEDRNRYLSEGFGENADPIQVAGDPVPHHHG
jgi:TatA/E family protein of Tat protein translocase